MFTTQNDIVASPEKQDVLYYLGLYGAPLGNLPILPRKPLSFEEVIVKALSFSRENPIVARTLPVVLAKNEARLKNFQKLREFVKHEGQENTLGFFLDLTSELTGNVFYKELSKEFEQSEQAPQDFFLRFNEKGKYGKYVLNKNTPVIARKWGFSINISLESFQAVFKKFMG